MNAVAEELSTNFSRWLPAYVGIGSNLSDPHTQVRRAFEALARLPNTLLISRSSLYRTAPFGDVVQPAFVNAAAGLLTPEQTYVRPPYLSLWEAEKGAAYHAVEKAGLLAPVPVM